jgi:DNA-binding transcriptional MerR regulator
MNKNQFYTIGALSKQFGLTIRALRLYEAKGLLTPTHKNRRRQYTEVERARISFIVQSKRVGLTLAEIRLLLPSDGAPEPLASLLDEQALKVQIEFLQRQQREIEDSLGVLFEMLSKYE